MKNKTLPAKTIIFRTLVPALAALCGLTIAACSPPPPPDWRSSTYIHDDCKLMDLETYAALNIVWQPGKGDLDDLNRRYQAARGQCLAASLTADPMAAMTEFNAIQEALGVARGDLSAKCLARATALQPVVLRDIAGLINVHDHYSDAAVTYAEGINHCTPGWAGSNALLGWHLLETARRLYADRGYTE